MKGWETGGPESKEDIQEKERVPRRSPMGRSLKSETCERLSRSHPEAERTTT